MALFPYFLAVKTDYLEFSLDDVRLGAVGDIDQCVQAVFICPEIIGIEKNDIVALSPFQAEVLRGSRSVIGFVENPYSAVKTAVFIAYGGRIVCASVIYKNQLIIAQRLGNHAFNAFAQVLFCIEDWNNYRNFHTLFLGAGG